MKFIAILNVLGLLPTIAYAIDGGRIAETLDIMADLSRDTLDSAVEMLPPQTTVDHYYPEVIRGFAEITTSAQNEVLVLSPNTKFLNTTLSRRNSMPPVPRQEQHDICTAFGSFVQVHTELLKVLIGKNDVLQQSERDSPGKMFNQQLLGNLEACSQAVTDLTQLTVPQVPTCADQVKSDKQYCDKTIHKLEHTLMGIENAKN